jgi:SAM-dependent methyltransferase
VNNAHLNVDYHRGYFVGQGRTRRIALGETPSVRRHVAHTIDPLNLRPGAHVLELGCGLGRFTEVLLNRGFECTALDLSNYLIDGLRDTLGGSPRLTPIVGRAEEVDVLAPGPFDAVVGFFFLHHVLDFDALFGAISRVLAPGGRIAFCEPNAFNPLFYLQMTLTPGMSWKGEPSVSKMRPGFLCPVLRNLGYEAIDCSSHGAFPQLLSNWPAGAQLESAIERMLSFSPFRAFRVFRARWGTARE